MAYNMGGGPVFNIVYGTATVAASAGGTAAATSLNSSFPMTTAKSFSVINPVAVPLEILFCKDGGTASWGVLIPASGSIERQPLALSKGEKIFVRTVLTTPATIAATTPVLITFWD